VFIGGGGHGVGRFVALNRKPVQGEKKALRGTRGGKRGNGPVWRSAKRQVAGWPEKRKKGFGGRTWVLEAMLGLIIFRPQEKEQEGIHRTNGKLEKGKNVEKGETVRAKGKKTRAL